MLYGNNSLVFGSTTFFSMLETKYLIETILMCQKYVSKQTIYSLKYEAKLSCMKIKWTAIGNKKKFFTWKQIDSS
jgi:hypothetical protein